MPDVHTVDLRPATNEQFTKLTVLEADRLARDKRSTGRPVGARLSTTCPVRRCKAVYDDWFAAPIHPGVGWRGHLLESYALAVLLEGHEYKAQSVIEWSHGSSAWDVEIIAAPEGSPLTGLIDWKSTASGAKPNGYNKAQADIMMVAAGMLPGSVLNHWMLHISNWTAVGPYPHELTVDAHNKGVLELAGTGHAIDYLQDLVEHGSEPAKSDEWDNPEWWHSHDLACDCGGCIPYLKADANNAIERIWYRYELAHDMQAEGQRLKDDMRDKLIEAAELHSTVRAAGDGKKVVIDVWGGDEGTITRSTSSKTGLDTWTIRRKGKA